VFLRSNVQPDAAICSECILFTAEHVMWLMGAHWMMGGESRMGAGGFLSHALCYATVEMRGYSFDLRSASMAVCYDP
jgi:hypothetical protein